MDNTNDEKMKVVLVGVNVNNDPEFESGLAELVSLAKACNYEVIDIEKQNVAEVNTGVYVGSGKVDEIKAVVHMLGADAVIFDNTLSPMQIRNLKDIIERPVFDRTHLILQIFSSRAQTREAQIQVQTARLQYELPRLTGMGEFLSRQGGNGGGGGLANKGAGEKKLELARRRIRHRISELKKELKEIEGNRETQRKRRVSKGIPQVALVGYTNAGKSSLMNALIDKYEPDREKAEARKVKAKDMLFATLDTTVRKISMPDHKEFLLSDTVGFINKLPHNLVQAFHSTLEEVKYADLLIQVIDYSNPRYKEHMEVTLKTLTELGAEKIPMLYVFNKCDLPDGEEDKELPEIPMVKGDSIYLSVKEGVGLDELVEMIRSKIYHDYVECTMLIPYTEGALISYFNENASIEETEYLAEGTKIKMNCLLKDVQKYKSYVVI